MFYFYLKSFLNKCRFRFIRKEALKHISWKDLFLYSFRQAFLAFKGTYSECLKTLRFESADTLKMDTPFGTVYLPNSMDQVTIQYLLREAFDKKHWHQYDTPRTPVTPDDIVVDCGASEGLWAFSIVQKAKMVYLIEPQAVFIPALHKTFASHIRGGKAAILEYAVGSKNGRCRMARDQTASLVETITLDPQGHIPLYRLDTIFDKKPVTFIKADLEGFEMEVLKGAQSTIQKNKPKIAVTVYHEDNSWQEMKDFVLSLVPDYQWQLKGMVAWGKPLMLHMWSGNNAPSQRPRLFW